jgi:hypothetical protein
MKVLVTKKTFNFKVLKNIVSTKALCMTKDSNNIMK